MADNRPIYRIAVPSPLRRLFDYLPPEDADSPQPRPGSRVKVPFGKRNLVGLVVTCTEASDQPLDRLKPIRQVLDSEPLLPAPLFDVLRWAADYYQHPPGEALLSALPGLLRRGEPASARRQCWRLSHHGHGLAEDTLKRAPRQRQLVLWLRRQGAVAVEAIRAAGIGPEVIRALRDKGLIESCQQTDDTDANSHNGIGDMHLLREQPLTLYPQQAQALAAIEPHGFNTWLLQGETGSGKTEVYLQIIEKVLRYGRQALVLIPEISLTPQTLDRFQRRFDCPIAVLHSGLTDHQRLAAWRDARNGRAGIVIGTRSAVFTPLGHPGIIIVDEEHDGSYKQQEGFRYSARDVAVMRASREQIPLVLGSATPSLESLHNCDRGRYHRLRLDRRPDGARQPEWQLVDIRGSQLDTGFSAPLIEAMAAELAAGNQILVFLNRRGYAPVLMCHDCGWTAICRHCDTRMTSHRRDNLLICHHCENRQPIPHLCPDCRSPGLQFLGQGTERGESLLNTLFPDIPVIRVDRDSTRRKDAMADIARQVDTGEPCILVGTQMLAKGHHFPGVTLVAVLDVDAGLFSSDFRATERMGQLLTQVAGRAGRGDRAGRVMIQSHHCDHPLITQLTDKGYDSFARTLLEQRAFGDAPPFRNLALIRAEAGSGREAEDFLALARRHAEQLHPPSPALSYLGPLPSALEKRGGRYRYQLSVLAENRPRLQQLLTRLCTELEGEKLARKVRWSVDVDPQDML